VNSVEGLMMNFDVVPVLIKEEVASSLLDEFERQLGRRPDSRPLHRQSRAAGQHR